MENPSNKKRSAVLALKKPGLLPVGDRALFMQLAGGNLLHYFFHNISGFLQGDSGVYRQAGFVDHLFSDVGVGSL